MTSTTHCRATRTRPPRRRTASSRALGALLGGALFFCSPLAPPRAAAYVDPSTGQPTAQAVLRGFDKPEKNWLPGHRGVDLALPIGAEVRAAGSGTVHFAGSVAGKPVVSILHSDGLRTTYEPVFARVRKGDGITEGDVIGTLAPPVDGSEGLHWGALVGPDDYIDPLSLLDAPVIRLKPVDEPGRRPL
ncbi:M23 family metallopeptidase [Corynebacterium sp.]|uniref:M23 family metallopeptidase n=1 Tax=Corynebacterium sp. TaxID=1720 RepID=UPI0026DC3ADC|nr:M23 family metallopeptidase [Corynebacterium sp.]MDO5032500.1 M23 family metallopeptidase [Corynebacterium sp.]